MSIWRSTLVTIGIASLSALPAQEQSGQPWPWVDDGEEVVSVLLAGDTNIQFRAAPERPLQ